jgi:hypothetical protein
VSDLVSLGLIYFAFVVAFVLGVAFAIGDVLAEKRYQRKRQTQSTSDGHQGADAGRSDEIVP